MVTPTTLPKLRDFAAKFKIKGLEITEVSDCSARVFTPHRDDEDWERRNFWLWLFSELCGAVHVVGPASCTFILRRRGPELPQTLLESAKKFFGCKPPQRYGPDVRQAVEVKEISLLNRNQWIIREKGEVSFMVSKEEASRLQGLGIKSEEVGSPFIGQYQVTLSPCQMEGLTLHLAQILFLWLV